MFVCTYVGMYVCMYVRMYVRMHACMYACMHVLYVSVSVCLYACTCTCVCMHACVLLDLLCRFLRTPKYYVCTDTHTHTHTHTHTCTRAHTHLDTASFGHECLILLSFRVRHSIRTLLLHHMHNVHSIRHQLAHDTCSRPFRNTTLTHTQTHKHIQTHTNTPSVLHLRDPSLVPSPSRNTCARRARTAEPRSARRTALHEAVPHTAPVLSRGPPNADAEKADTASGVVNASSTTFAGSRVCVRTRTCAGALRHTSARRLGASKTAALLRTVVREPGG